MNSLSIINPAEKSTSLSNVSNHQTQEQFGATDQLVNEKSEVGIPLQGRSMTQDGSNADVCICSPAIRLPFQHPTIFEPCG